MTLARLAEGMAHSETGDSMQTMVPQMKKIRWKMQEALLRVLRERGYHE